MSGCFGEFHVGGRPANNEVLKKMDAAMAYWGPDGGGLHVDGQIGLGSRLLRITPEDQFEQQPLVDGNLALIAHVRLDNRAELCSRLGLVERLELTDSALILAAYRRDGDGCVEHLLGDWVFALWDKAKQRLLIARDACGNTGLYWWEKAGTLVFSNGMKGVLAHPEVPHQPNPRAVAGLLTVFTDPEIEDATVYAGIRRLPPGHRLVADARGIKLERWWQPENLSLLELPTLEDYYAAFLEIYDDAVAKRLRVHGGTVAATLSAGLDSGSVVALAARHLEKRGQRLTAYVHTPLHAPLRAGAKRIGNEYPLALQTAQHVGNVDAISLRSEGISVLQGIEQCLSIHDAPSHAAANGYWITDILKTARAGGARVLLTGQRGNATVSFSGNGSLLPDLVAGRVAKVFSALRDEETGFWLGLKRRIAKPLLQPARVRLKRYLLRYQGGGALPFLNYSAIHPQFADELHLVDRMRDTGHDPYFVAPFDNGAILRRFRLATTSAGTGFSAWMENGAAFQLDTRDPTCDRRLVEFCWCLPDRVFWGRGEQRALIRKGMHRQMPPEVLLNNHKGLQSSDLGGRLIAEINVLLQQIERLEHQTIAAAWLDLPRLRECLLRLEKNVNPENVASSARIVARGLSVGLFLSRF